MQTDKEIGKKYSKEILSYWLRQNGQRELSLTPCMKNGYRQGLDGPCKEMFCRTKLRTQEEFFHEKKQHTKWRGISIATQKIWGQRLSLSLNTLRSRGKKRKEM